MDTTLPLFGLSLLSILPCAHTINNASLLLQAVFKYTCRMYLPVNLGIKGVELTVKISLKCVCVFTEFLCKTTRVLWSKDTRDRYYQSTNKGQHAKTDQIFKLKLVLSVAFTVGFTAACFMGADILWSHDQLNMTRLSQLLASFICGEKVIKVYSK